MLQHAALLAFTFLGTVLILIPTAFHIQNRNVAVVCLCLWLSIFNGITFLNGIIWNGPMTEETSSGQGYCDITTRIQLTAQPALLGCAIAILRFLATILSSKGVSTNLRTTRLRQTSIDLALIFSVPLLMLVMQLLVYRNPRYTVSSFYGCSLTFFTPQSPYMLFLFIWSPLMGLASIFYAGSIIAALHRKRNEFRQVIKNSSSGLDVSRFLRLFILAILAIFVIAPIAFAQFYILVRQVSVAARRVPRGSFTEILVLEFEPTWDQLWLQWFSAIISILFAGLFGIGREARNNYQKWFTRLPGSERLLHLSNRFSSQVSRNWSGRFSRQSRYSASQVSELSVSDTLRSSSAADYRMSAIKVTTKITRDPFAG